MVGNILKRGAMTDDERLILEAWEKLEPGIMADPDELNRRLARRRMKILTQPVWASAGAPVWHFFCSQQPSHFPFFRCSPASFFSPLSICWMIRSVLLR